MSDIQDSRRAMRNADLSALKDFLVAKWPSGLPSLFDVWLVVMGEEFKSVRRYSSFGRIGTRDKWVRIGTPLKLRRALEQIGLRTGPGDWPRLKGDVLYAVQAWSGRLHKGAWNVTLNDLLESCNQHLHAQKIGQVSAKALAAFLRLRGWQTVRRSDGIWIKYCQIK